MFCVFAGKCLFLSGLVPRPMNAENDKELLSYGIGFTNIVERTTRANQELSRQEIEEGGCQTFIVMICVRAWIEVKQTEPPLVCCILSRHAVTAVQGSIQGCQAVLLDKRQLSEHCTVIHTRLISLYQQLYRIIKPSLILIVLQEQRSWLRRSRNTTPRLQSSTARVSTKCSVEKKSSSLESNQTKSLTQIR